MCYNRTKVVETRINTGFLAVFYRTQFAQKPHITTFYGRNIKKIAFFVRYKVIIII